MAHTYSRRRCQHFSVLFCLLLLLSACSQLSGSGTSSTSTPKQMKTSLMPSTPVQVQTCPAQATARAASMSPLQTSNHSYLIYAAQQGDTSVLQRYDVTTGSRQTILQTQTSETIQGANVSPDGQWLLLRSLLQGQVAIQLIRVNGQQLQTLYCAPVQENIDDALLSSDQHTLVFNQEDQDGLSTLYLLDVATGKLRMELSPLQPNYPGIAQGPVQTALMSEYAPPSVHDKRTGTLTIHPFNPLNQSNGLASLRKIHTDGSGLTQLMVAQTVDMDLGFASSNYLPWSIISRDGRQYALTMNNMTNNASALIVGDLNGGQPQTIASSGDGLVLVGWA